LRRAAKVDDNQQEIIAAFRKAGASVKPVHTVKGFVDVVVGINGKNMLVEIKDGNKVKSKRKLTEKEQEFHSGWKGSIHIVESLDDVARVLAGQLPQQEQERAA
jgi:hypothetical protein